MTIDRLGFAQGLSLLVVLLLLVACGGGGGESPPPGPIPPVYSGNLNPAVITVSNASRLAGDVIGSEDTAAPILGGVTVTSNDAAPNPGSGAIDLALRLKRGFRNTVQRVNDAQRAALALQVDQTEPCDNGVGSIRTTGTLNDANFTGTLAVSFNNCLIDGDTFNGQATLRVDVFGFVPQPIITDSTMQFAVLSIRGPGVSVDSGGSIRLQLDFGTNTETVTANVDSRNNNAGETSRTETLKFVNVYDNLYTPASFAVSVSGKVFDHVHGYVAITTVTPLAFSTLGQLFPNSGQMVLTGEGTRSIRAKALSATLVRLELDIDGIGGFEHSATLKWTDLSGPVGADLRDNDGDGMHNSWETVVGLNPILADGVNDDDSDGFSNLAEYQGGGDPKSAANAPSMLVGPVFQVAGAVAVANSDVTRPGKSGIGTDGTNYLLASCRDLGPTVGLFGVTISGSGQVLSNFPIINSSCPQHPAVSFDGGNYLVLYSASGRITGTRVTPAGAVLDGSVGFAVSSVLGSNFHAAIAFDGTNYLAVWMKFLGSAYWIYGATITPAGVVSSEFPISSGNGDVFPAIAFDGTNFLVVWTQTSGDPGDVLGARVSKAGAVLDSPAFAIANLPGIQSATGVAFDGTNYLVVWDHQLSSGVSPPPDGKIFGRRIAQSGALLDGTASNDGIPISTGLYANHSSSVAFAGSNFVVTWAVGSFPNLPPAGIFAARVSKSGTRIDGLPSELGVAISGTPTSTSRFVYPVAASLGQSALISWVNNKEQFGAQKEILGASVAGF